VDRPATQRWKRAALADAGVAAPDGLTFVPVDFESERLWDRLLDSGLDPARPAYVSWLGVTMYLTRAALAGAVAGLGNLAVGSELVADHLLPRELLDRTGRWMLDAMDSSITAGGEPWRTYLAPGELSILLGEHGFHTVDYLPLRDAIDARLWKRHDALRPMDISQLVRAVRRPVGGSGPALA
jgi:methyltransferase (TIGR00027 family)